MCFIQLDQKAQAAADRIAAHGTGIKGQHSNWDFLTAKDNTYIGENLYESRGNGNGNAVNGWKTSPEHKKRLDDKTTTQLGVGFAKDKQGRSITVGTYHPALFQTQSGPVRGK